MLGLAVVQDTAYCSSDGATSVTRLLQTSTVGVVCCTHGEALEPVTQRFAALGVDVGDQQRDPLLLKGAVWELNADQASVRRGLDESPGNAHADEPRRDTFLSTTSC